MKKIILTVVCLSVFALSTVKAQQEGYVFTPVQELKITPVQNQNRTGTCWSFSSLAFVESELIRMGKGEHNLSEMFVVNYSYKDKAEKYVRTHGTSNFSEGGSFYDVLYVLKHYGIVPEAVMSGLEYGEEMHVHNELVGASTAFVESMVRNRNGKLSTSWKKAFGGIIDAYLGKIPETFTYSGKEYTPQGFVKELGFNADDYVSLTSFTHHPFYSRFVLEIPDNWRWGESYNLPLNEFMAVFDQAINAGYTIAWASDVSEPGFSRNGIAVAPDVEAIETSGSDQARWVGLDTQSRNDLIRRIAENPCQELTITPELRQQGYDNYQTTDDHGMQIYGIAKDQTGKKFYMVKNSWGTGSKYEGLWYVSEAFVAYKTINIVVHKDALPKAIKDKLGLK